MGIQTMYLENVPESAECEKAARDLIEQGCNVIYAISFGHMEYISNVADEYPEVYFNHATGYITKPNMSTYMGRLYEVQYLTGIAAGMRTETNKIGIVTTFPIPECVRQVNAFTLGVRSVNPEATVEVKWTSSWFDPATEKSAATELLNGGCDVIAAYCDTMNPQMAAAERGVWATGCSSSGAAVIPQAYLTAPLFNYAEFYTKDVQRILDGTWVSGFSWLGLNDGVVALDDLTENCAPGTAEAIEPVKAAIMDGSFNMWAGEIKDNTGAVRVEAGQQLTDEDLLAFDWFVEGVIGTVG
jgi:basic membrane protein A